MSNINVTIRMDQKLKKQADKLFDELGMSLTTAITLFAKQAVRVQGIPFEITKDVPNATTVKAMNEYKSMSKKNSKYKRYNNFDELVKETKK